MNTLGIKLTEEIILQQLLDVNTVLNRYCLLSIFEHR